MTTYEGTKITGTKASATVFKKSGLGWVQQGDWYKNVDTGHVYYCMREGYPTKTKYWDSKSSSYKYYEPATWKYDHTDAVKKPNERVTKLCAPKRGKDNLTFTSTWDVPKSLTDSKNGRRASKLLVSTYVYYNYMNEAFFASSKKYGTTYKSHSVNLNSSSFKLNKKTGRQAFYPYTNYICEGIIIEVAAVNKNGTGPSSGEAVLFKKPDEPTVGTPTLDTANGVVKCTITPAKDDGVKERALTRYQIQKMDVGYLGDKKWTTVEDAKSSDSAFTVSSGELVNWQNSNHHWVIAVRARSEGLAGASEWTKWKYCGVGWPKKASVGSVVIADATDLTRHGYLQITETNSTKEYPVDQVVLQRLVSTTASTAEEANAVTPQDSPHWEDTEAKDNDKCTALSFVLSDVDPSVGKHSWVRIKSWNDIEGVFDSFSEPKEIWQLYKAGAADNECTIASADPVDGDPSSMWVVVAWDKASTTSDDDTTSIELAWDNDPDAWSSNKPPEPFEFSWSDPSPSVSGWEKTATVKVKDLEEGETYWFKARCIVDDGNSRTEGDWCKAHAGIPSLSPEGAVLSAPPSVPRGSDIRFSWSISGGGVQKEWQLMMPNGKTSIMEKKGPIQSCTVSADRAQDCLTNGILKAFVRVSTGGGTVDSDAVEVRIADPPVLSIGDIATLDEQPLEIPLACSVPGCGVTIVVSAKGCSMQMPDGIMRQTNGDTVWSSVVYPSWTLSSGSYTANIVTDEGRKFLDGAEYTVEAVAFDTVSGLKSGTATKDFSVGWARQAPQPPDEIEVVADASEDGDGVHRRAEIHLAAPQDAGEDDVYDVYRVTGDGAQLIASGVALDTVVTDEYAPFGEGTHLYRVAARTPDGDVCWKDFDYWLEGVGLRFDFEGDSHDYVELRWNVKQQDSYAKDFYLSKAADGTKAGAWNAAVERKGSYQTDVIKVVENDKVDAIRDLARTADAVFVRTSAGLAFAANVDVDSMDIDGKSKGIAVSFSATEIDQDDRFKGALPVEEEEPGA